MMFEGRSVALVAAVLLERCARAVIEGQGQIGPKTL